MAQEVEHILGKDEEVTLTLSAIPCDLIADRLIKSKSAAMAQEVEHILGKDEVTGSNPVSSSRRKTTRYCGFSLVLWVKTTIKEIQNIRSKHSSKQDLLFFRRGFREVF